MNSTLISRSAFAGLAVPKGEKRGVLVTDRDGLGLATVLVGKQQRDSFSNRVQERFGIELVQGPHRSEANGLAFAGTGPGAWLAMRDRDSNNLAAALQEALGDLAAVSDQSDTYAVLRLTGPHVRDTLAKLLPIDLHARAFPPGAVAVTVAAHIGTTLWRLEDCPEGWPVFEIAVARSMAGSFWYALLECAGEFGVSLERHVARGGIQHGEGEEAH